jgi:hypothetical protein
MNRIDLIRWAMTMTEGATANLVADLRDVPLTRPAPGSGNHPLWLLGHLCWIEGNLRHIIVGESNPVAHWGPLFAAGTQPKSDASVYPPFDELLAK